MSAAMPRHGHDGQDRRERQDPRPAASGDAPPPLLHNIGWASRASIVWRGFGRGPLSDTAERLEAARTRGTWLDLGVRVPRSDPRWQPHWNTAAAVLSVLEPGHGLDEAAAMRRLIERIDAHAQRLDWPPWLLAAPPDAQGGTRARPGVALDHAETVFVALAKSTGSLWLRSRAPRLAPLHAPCVDVPGARGGHATWRTALWFPRGLPPTLLDAAAAQARGSGRARPYASSTGRTTR